MELRHHRAYDCSGRGITNANCRRAHCRGKRGWLRDDLRDQDRRRYVSDVGRRGAGAGARGISGAQQMALTNANKKCDSMGKSIDVTNIDTGHEFPANGRAIVTFTCK
jgi:hypothetical protein